MMRLDLDAPIAPRGGRSTITIRYRFAVPEHGSDRMGRDGMLFEMAQWYPRMAVYDDVRGWNTDPYLGQGEFYLEYGDIDYSVTVPAGYVSPGAACCRTRATCCPPSSATGSRRRARCRPLRTGGDGRVDHHERRGRGRAIPSRRWRAHVAIPGGERARRRVGRGAGFPVGRDELERRALSGVLPVPEERPRLGEGAEQTCWSIRTYSTLVYPYPYPQATSVAGPVGGMEYPMFVMVDTGSDDPASVFGTIDHEQGHEWFPMLVGSNERRFAWMDEGLNTYINTFSAERRYPGTTPWNGYVKNWRDAVEGGTQSPLMTPPDRIDASALGALAYRKPAAVLLTLRNHVVGADTFDRAIREYARRWAFRHPTPGDFFRTIENVSGRDLSWYWRSFWYTSDVLDIALDSVTSRATPTGELQVSLYMHRTTSIPFPVAARLAFVDGRTMDVAFPVELWGRPHVGDHIVGTVNVPARVVGARLWPQGGIPDWDPSNDVWGSAPPARTVESVTGVP